MNAYRLLKGASSALSVSVVAGGLLAGSALGGAAHAHTVTIDFTGLWGEGDGMGATPWVEDGVTVRGLDKSGALGAIMYWNRADTPHLDDAGTPFLAGLQFTAPVLFDAKSFEYFGGGFACITVDDTCVPYNNLELKGYAGGALVASKEIIANSPNEFDPPPGLHSFGSMFKALDTLTILAKLPTPGFGFDLGICSPCSHFNIDNVVLALQEEPAPIPVPAAVWLMGTALAGLGAFARRRRKHA